MRGKHAMDLSAINIARFEAKVLPEPTSGCWLWIGHLGSGGYGKLGKKPEIMAHRFSYELHVGPIPAELELDHLCRVKCCVNPRHLEPVTHRENLRRGGGTARHVRENRCKRGHLFDDANTITQKNGTRQCRTCANFHSRARWRMRLLDRAVARADRRGMRLVLVESPYAGDIDTNLRYLRACLRACLLRAEAPYASHALYTQSGVLDDANQDERRLGIDAGLAWGLKADATVVFTDLGISSGMQLGIADAQRVGRRVEFRTLPEWEAESRAIPAAQQSPPAGERSAGR